MADGLTHTGSDDQAENKFKCPCHGSQYNAQGKVIRGPAPLVRQEVSCHTGIPAFIPFYPHFMIWISLEFA